MIYKVEINGVDSDVIETAMANLFKPDEGYTPQEWVEKKLADYLTDIEFSQRAELIRETAVQGIVKIKPVGLVTAVEELIDAK